MQPFYSLSPFIKLIFQPWYWCPSPYMTYHRVLLDSYQTVTVVLRVFMVHKIKRMSKGKWMWGIRIKKKKKKKKKEVACGHATQLYIKNTALLLNQDFNFFLFLYSLGKNGHKWHSDWYSTWIKIVFYRILNFRDTPTRQSRVLGNERDNFAHIYLIKACRAWGRSVIMHNGNTSH